MSIAIGCFPFLYLAISKLDILDASMVDDENKTKVLVKTIFKLGKGWDARELGNRTVLKQYAHDVYMDGSAQNTLLRSNLIQLQIPLHFYDENTEFCTLLESFQSTGDIKEIYSDIDTMKWVYCSYSVQYSIGCEHFMCGCQIFCEQCNEFYKCKKCHDDQTRDHQLAVSRQSLIKCTICNEKQELNDKCVKCNKIMYNQFCEPCQRICYFSWDANVFFHCDSCGHCNQGSKDRAVHCNSCQKCVKQHCFSQHSCTTIENCIVCLEELKESKLSWFALKCGHQLHYDCYNTLLRQNNYKCPVCTRFSPIGDDYNKIVERQIFIFGNTLVKFQLRDTYIMVRCNDCGDNFPNRHSPCNLYWCDKCKLLNCSETGQQASREQYEQYLQDVNPRQVQKQSSVESIKQYFIQNLRNSLNNEYSDNQIIDKVEKLYQIQIVEQNINIYENLINSCVCFSFDELKEQFEELKRKMGY